MASNQGWFESDESYRDRTAKEANERTIEQATGSAPRQSWLESETEYRDRISKEANERIVQQVSGQMPQKGWFEGDDAYRVRLEEEANIRTIEKGTGTSPSRGFFESYESYNIRVRKEANEHIIREATSVTPRKGMFEGSHTYRSRIAHEARVLRSGDQQPHNTLGSSHDYPVETSEPNSTFMLGCIGALTAASGALAFGYSLLSTDPETARNSPATREKHTTLSVNTPQYHDSDNINPKDIPVDTPLLPKYVSEYISRHGMSVPNSIDPYCGFDFSNAANPFVTEGDFDSDNKLDHSVVIVAQQTRKTLVFLGNGEIASLPGADYLSTVRKRGKIVGFEGSIILQADAIETVHCEKSSALYYYDSSIHGFQEFWLSD